MCMCLDTEDVFPLGLGLWCSQLPRYVYTPSHLLYVVTTVVPHAYQYSPNTVVLLWQDISIVCGLCDLQSMYV